MLEGDEGFPTTESPATEDIQTTNDGNSFHNLNVLNAGSTDIGSSKVPEPTGLIQKTYYFTME